MAQKAATVGITLLAAISAPTGLAIRLAEETGLTLIGFARGSQCNVYANPQRLTSTLNATSRTSSHRRRSFTNTIAGADRCKPG